MISLHFRNHLNVSKTAIFGFLPIEFCVLVGWSWIATIHDTVFVRNFKNWCLEALQTMWSYNDSALNWNLYIKFASMFLKLLFLGFMKESLIFPMNLQQLFLRQQAFRYPCFPHSWLLVWTSSLSTNMFKYFILGLPDTL